MIYIWVAVCLNNAFIMGEGFMCDRIGTETSINSSRYKRKELITICVYFCTYRFLLLIAFYKGT